MIRYEGRNAASKRDVEETTSMIYVATSIILAVALDLYLVRGWNRYRRLRKQLKESGNPENGARSELMLRAFSLDLGGAYWRRLVSRATIEKSSLQRYHIAIELALIAIWALFVGKDYLKLDPYLSLGVGNDDFILSIFPYFPLQRFWACGDCILWNGLMNGGSPTFADSIGALLHPIMYLLIIFFGTMNGIKLAMIVSLIMGGWAVWWIAQVLRLGIVARLWSGIFAVVGGHLAGPLFSGDVGIVFSTAAASLAIAPGLSLAINGRRRDAILFGLMLGQALLAGQAYLQLGLVLGVLPIFSIFVLDRRLRFNGLWKQFALALCIAALLAAPIIFSVFSMLNHLAQPMEPRGTQSLEYLPLNLVIRDMNYFVSPVLEKIPSPNVYLLYIGWVPIILAFTGWGLISRKQKKLYLFFVLAIANLYFIASSLPFNWLRDHLPDFFLSARNLPFILGLAVTLILGLAAWTVDLIWHLDWPAFFIRRADQSEAFKLDTRIVIFLILISAIRPVYEFNRSFRILAEWPADLVRAAESLKSEPTGWVRPIYGNWTYIAAAVNKNIKITDAYRIWTLKERSNPPFSIDAGEDPEMLNDPNYYKSSGAINYVAHPENPYASVSTDKGIFPCEARADGGHIDVNCDISAAGELTVYENSWSGWAAWRDGQRIPLIAGEWLKVDLPPGNHTVQFRFRPLNVSLGLLLAAFGAALSFGLWMQPEPIGIPAPVRSEDHELER